MTLIDSRTGITDSGGVCTIQLPDILVPVLIANRQTLDGTSDIIRRVQKARNDFDWDRPPATILPLAARFESRAEFTESQDWLSEISKTLAESYGDWLPKHIDTRKILERTKIPHVAKFSFGEKLAVLLASTSDPEGLGYAYETIAALLFHDFRSAEEIITERDRYVREMDLGVLRNYNWDVFLSYSQKDNGLAQGISNSLQKAGFRAWTDLMIQAGEDIKSSTQTAMKSSRFLVLLITKDFHISSRQREEIRPALQLAKQSYGRQFVIPVYVDAIPLELPIGLEKIQGIKIHSTEDSDMVVCELRKIQNQLTHQRASLIKSRRWKFRFKRIDRFLVSKRKYILYILLTLLSFGAGFVIARLFLS